ncbi:MAG: CopG family transcriptional regulator [Candidatus Altiarchaeales archaeon WOR_SM1_79]|nr:MAG: CopG family transcriptional regulator [Candidatus Altiarchaeales archaeon WOR_SM1_79]
MANSKRVLVSFTEKQWELIEKLRGEFGNGDSDIVRGIVMAWLSEKSFVTDSAKNKEN